MFRIIEKLIEISGWIRIAASPFFAGLMLGGIIFFYQPGKTQLVIALLIALAGLVFGILLANKIWKTKQGTIGFLSRIYATPELEKNEDSGDSR